MRTVDGTTHGHILNSVDARRRQLYAKACEWIERNPQGFSLLTHRSLDHTNQQQKFSIRQLCEKLRWEKQHGILKGDESYAIPNEITRYIGWEIMRLHPQTEKWMSTRGPQPLERDGFDQMMEHVQKSTGLPTGVDNYPRGTAIAAAFWTRSVLSADSLVLVWNVDLETSLGKCEDDNEPDVYQDGRFTTIIDRLKSRLKEEDGSTPLVVRVRTQWRGWVGMEYSGNQTVTVSEWCQLNPPIGWWSISSESGWKIADNQGMTIEVPSSFFMDGIPF